MGELLMTHRDANIAYDIWGKAGTGNPSSPLTAANITPNDIEWYKWGLLEPGAATGQLNYYRALLLMESGLLKQDPEVRLCYMPRAACRETRCRRTPISHDGGRGGECDTWQRCANVIQSCGASACPNERYLAGGRRVQVFLRATDRMAWQFATTHASICAHVPTPQRT